MGHELENPNCFEFSCKEKKNICLFKAWKQSKWSRFQDFLGCPKLGSFTVLLTKLYWISACLLGCWTITMWRAWTRDCTCASCSTNCSSTWGSRRALTMIFTTSMIFNFSTQQYWSVLFYWCYENKNLTFDLNIFMYIQSTDIETQ